MSDRVSNDMRGEARDELEAVLPASSADTDRLRGELARRAAAEGLLDVAYREVGSPIGVLLLAATPRGLVYTGFESEDRDGVLAVLADKLGPRVARSEDDPVLAVAAEHLHDYLVGRRRTFDVPVDTALATGFRGEVQQHLASLDYGRTATYKELATQLGRPGAVRAVGTACATNPLPLIWPCHRVLRTDGGLGGYRGGTETKARLLAMESAA